MRTGWMALVLAVGWAAGMPVRAGNTKQVDHAAKEGRTETTLRFVWQVPGRGKDALTAVVSTAEVEADKAIKRKVQIADLYAAVGAAAREAGRAYPKVQLVVKVGDSGVQVGAKGPPRAAEAAMAAAQDAMQARRAAWFTENQVFEIQPGVLSYDHVAVVAARTDAVAPVAAALRAGTDTDRDFIARTLGFSQSIPYQKGRRGADTGFQRPMALLARNKGDCDGKAALFLSLVRAELPHVPTAIVYVPGHALVGLGIAPQPGDATFSAGGRTFVYAEPVGPGAVPLGRVAPENTKALKKATVRVVDPRDKAAP